MVRTCTHLRVAHAFRPALVALRVPLQLPEPDVDNLQSACPRPAETSSTRSRAVECGSAFASVFSCRCSPSSTRKRSALRVSLQCVSAHSTCACTVDISMRFRARDRDFERRATIRTSELTTRPSTQRRTGNYCRQAPLRKHELRPYITPRTKPCTYDGMVVGKQHRNHRWHSLWWPCRRV